MNHDTLNDMCTGKKPKDNVEITHIYSKRRFGEFDLKNSNHRGQGSLTGQRFDAIVVHCDPEDLHDDDFLDWFQAQVWTRRATPGAYCLLEVSCS